MNDTSVNAHAEMGCQEDVLRAIATSLQDGDWPTLAERLGFATERRVPIPTEAYPVWGIEPEAADGCDGVEVLAAEAHYRLLLVHGGDFAELRRMMMSVHRLNPEQLVLWWWWRTHTLSVAVVDQRSDGRPFVRRLDLDRRAPDALGLEQLAALDIGDLARGDVADSTRALERHVREVLEQEGLTRRFFAGFTRALEQLRDAMVDGPQAERDRHHVALATLLRLVFLYFLQRRGALDDDRRFVLRKLRQARAAGQNFYATVLRPLFFGALNRPAEEREPAIGELGELPFLNGGLFEPLPVEAAHPALGWADDVWGEVIENLLERFHFAAEEMQGADEQRAVDPEMLGRVFEGLMYGDSRRRSGSFYTPRDIVRRLVDEALAGYLGDRTSLSHEQVDQLLGGRRVTLSEARREDVREALRSVHILDPAVGTGAFLLEALHALRRCWRALGNDASGDPLAQYRRVRELIHDHLFGVDIQHTAVRLCELRLWLSLLTTLPRVPIDEIPPLPNLSHKVCVGNSLVAPTDLVELRAGTSSFTSWAASLEGQSNRQLLDDLREAQDEYLTTHGSPKKAVRRRIGKLEEKLQRAMLHGRRQALAERLRPIERLSASRDLFGDDVSLDTAQRRERDELVAQIDAVDAALDALDKGREAPLAFSYATRFGQLVEHGGFDIVITNPPWVRAHNIDAAQRDVLRARYRSHRRRLWPSAKRAGIRAPFGPQVDLAALFVERSLELLRPGGRLCGLVPAKLLSSLHGTALRELLAEHALVALEDYSDGDRRLFDATVYPAMVHVQKSPRPRERQVQRPARRPPDTRVAVWRGAQRHSWTADASTVFSKPDEPGAPWVLAEPSVTRIFEGMRAVSVPLGEVDALQPLRGLFTGCNDVFVHSDAEVRSLLGADTDAFSRPVVSGRDVRPWSVDTDRRIFWPYDARMNFRDDLPEDLRRYFAGHAERLVGRSDYRPDKPLWQMFRVKPELVRPKVVWRDLSPKLEAALAPAGMVPLNTVYFIALRDERRARLLAGLMNSAPMRAVAYALGERARGGWRRHFAWVIRMLPVPERFVDFVEGADDAGLLTIERALRTNPRASDRLASELFELSADDVATLRRWRVDEEAA